MKKLAKAAPMMTSGGFVVFCGEDPSPCYTAAPVCRGICIPEWPIPTDLEWLWLLLKGWSICIGGTERTLNQNPSKTLPTHHFEVTKKDVYELL